MADTAIGATTVLTEGTISADLVAGGTSVTTGNVAVITPGVDVRRLIIGMYAASASIVTIGVGGNPPSQRAGLGTNATNTVGAGTAVLLMVEAAHYLTAAGTIRITVGANTVIFRVFAQPNTI